MTPKEKAAELVEKFIKYGWMLEKQAMIQSAKRCALIAVEEILAAHLFDEDEKEYWQQVKIEIENL